MRHFILIGILYLIVFVSGCSTIQVEVAKELQGTWVIEEFQTEKGDVLWDELKVNMLTFNEDGTFDPPLRDLQKREKALWKVEMRNDVIFLVISKAEDSIFNGDFKLNFSERRQGDASLKVILMSSNDLTMKCSK